MKSIGLFVIFASLISLIVWNTAIVGSAQEAAARFATEPEPIEFTGTASQRGQELFSSNGCVACHNLDGSPGIGPNLVGIWGTEQALQGGGAAFVDEAYVIESITMPQAKLVAGYEEAAMPSYDWLSEEEIRDLAAFVRSLR